MAYPEAASPKMIRRRRGAIRPPQSRAMGSVKEVMPDRVNAERLGKWGELLKRPKTLLSVVIGVAVISFIGWYTHRPPELTPRQKECREFATIITERTNRKELWTEAYLRCLLQPGHQ